MPAAVRMIVCHFGLWCIEICGVWLQLVVVEPGCGLDLPLVGLYPVLLA